VNALEKLLRFIERLEAQHVWYRLEHVRDSMLVLLSIPGQRWEVEFFPDGRVEVERFVSTGKIEDEDTLASLSEESTT
jgi:hypothetical protein